MAKMVQTQQQIIAESWWQKTRIVAVGLGAGISWWAITAILRQYVVEPLACKDLSTATACVNSLDVSGAIATVVVAVLGLGVLIRLVQPRPIIPALASAVVLWNLGGLVSGLAWWATLLIAIGLYAVSYTLFTMVARIQWLVWSIVVAVIITAGIRIILAL